MRSCAGGCGDWLRRLTGMREGELGEWVLLLYRLPREPSRPRISVWRRLDRLGVARLGDGLVALPADARTREQLEWVADEVVDAGGTAMVWLARLTSRQQERELAAGMATARAAEYTALVGEAAAAHDADVATRVAVMRRLRERLHRIGRRDYFPPPQRDLAHAAIAALAESLAARTAVEQEERA